MTGIKSEESFNILQLRKNRFWTDKQTDGLTQVSESSSLLPDNDVSIHIYTETLERISETSEGSSRTSSRLGCEEGVAKPKTKLYKRRWYIIAAFSLFCLLQVLILLLQSLF